jgi:hypothetical protein
MNNIVIRNAILIGIFLLLSFNANSENLCSEKDSINILTEKYDEFYLAKDYKNSIKCAQYGFNIGDKFLSIELAYSYTYHLSYDEDPDEIYYEKAYQIMKSYAEKGDKYAKSFLYYFYKNGTKALDIDLTQSFQIIKLTHETNNKIDTYDAASLAEKYYYGLGTNINYDRSFALLEQVFSIEGIENMHNTDLELLAYHYILGRGVNQNIQKGADILDYLIGDNYAEYQIHQNLQMLFGKNFKDKENRKVKTLFFNQSENNYLEFGHNGFNIQESLIILEKKNDTDGIIKLAKRVVDKSLKQGRIFFETCYALGDLVVAYQNLKMGKLHNEDILFYAELAYEFGCGSVHTTNLAIVYDMQNLKSQDEIHAMLYQNLKLGNIYTISYFADSYNFGRGFKEDFFKAYILYNIQLEYEVRKNSQDRIQNNINILLDDLSRENIKKADKIIDFILHEDFSKIFDIISSDSKSFEGEILSAEINALESIKNNNKDSKNLSELQLNKVQSIVKENLEVQEILSNDKNYIQSIENDEPVILINDEIILNGLVATITGEITDSSNIAAVFIDGTPLPIDKSNKGKVLLEQSFFIGDKNKLVEIIAYDKWGLFTKKVLEITKVVESQKIDYGDYYALIIGNNNYKNLPDLKTAVYDAKKIKEVLLSQYGFTQVDLILDGTRSQILDKLYEYRKKLKFHDNLLIYYAGHGEIDRSIGEGYWQPIDAEADNPTNWIDNNTITSYIKGIKAKHVLIIADSCYSGLLVRGNNTLTETYANREIMLQRLSKKKARWVFTSGGSEPVVDGGGGDHSLFAGFLLDVLENNKKELTITELYQLVIPKVIANGDQTPEHAPLHKSGHDGGEFIFVSQN